MILVLFLISVVTLEVILYRDRKRSPNQAPPKPLPDDTRASLLCLANALGPSVAPRAQSPQEQPPPIETPLESGRRTDLH